MKIAGAMSFVYNAAMARPYQKPVYFDAYSDFIPDYEEFSTFQAQLPPVIIRRNALKCSPEEFDAFLQRHLDDGAFAAVRAIEFAPDCFEVDAPRAIVGGLWEHHVGLYYVLGSSSVIPALALEPQPHEHILDMCAAPGGKTGVIAQLMQDTGLLVANEPSNGRRRVLKANVERIGATNVAFTNYFGEKFPPTKLFDRILLDGPCSAEGSLRGTWSKVFDYERNHTYRDGLQRSQRKLLRHACDLLKPGGRLVYATCTYDPCENEMQVESLLEERTDMSLITPNVAGPWESGVTHWQGKDLNPEVVKTRRIYPHRFNSWGFYFATFIKRS